MVFVFGSNLAGRHSKGAARDAKDHHGAEYGVGVGPTGNAYAIPTKDADLHPLALETIARYVNSFIMYAALHPNENFFVTRIGCGLAGYKDEQIAPFFKAAPLNCSLDPAWNSILSRSVSVTRP